MKIREVTLEGFTYVNLDKETFVDFKECNENWVMYNKRKNSWTDDEVQAFRTKSKCVGERDICAKPCCFTFFTKPFTKIEFTNFNAKKEFRDFQMKILEVGWTTFDMS
ncbi:hypothetical protein LOZ80_06245 [Paenibacillus sp. HWE-109]|uniref:hypothetical protein n=1 Tax=Paenibacillus sp. HWE-109 TaxID=1306526 RepID=UPI001EDEC69A|nr:hypothetical protein [Paenibacillus sp. HWE-109]UKS28530.1 hypothetical protein LOZ80_06245 [Paenibacillus sp. HWE-109]